MIDIFFSNLRIEGTKKSALNKDIAHFFKFFKRRLIGTQFYRKFEPDISLHYSIIRTSCNYLENAQQLEVI